MAMRNVRYEDLRDAYVLDYQTNKRKSLRWDKNGNAYLDSVSAWTISSRAAARPK
jgi:hypothetical protein